MKVEGKVALVTGGASGLGLATVKKLHEGGASVVLVDLPSSAGAEVANELGERVVFAPADVTSEPQIEAALDVAERLGELRAVVHCAGIGGAARILGKDGPMPLDRYRRVIEVNLVGTFNVLRLAAARLARLDELEGERGVIVMTASVAAFEGQIGQAAYTSSKAGVHGLTICAARDLASARVRVCTIAPGLFETPMLLGLPDEARASLASQVPNPSRLGRPAEYAALASHIIENPMLNGETIRLDGAIRMAPR
jgi:NAD(P)-dependent dehydrogenase (short-subunit alcohol dehydrogenase family)